MTLPSQVRLYATTVAHLRPSQVAHRVRLRCQRSLGAWLPETVWRSHREVPAPGWPPGFEPLDRRLALGCPSPEANAAGAFSFLGETRDLGDPHDWAQAEASHLWRFHLHYFEWAWGFAAHRDRAWARAALAELWRSWRAATTVGRGDTWSPYVASIRAWALCGVFDSLIRGSAIEQDVVDHLVAHRRFLRAHIEYDVGGNHLVKNLKALIGLGVFLGDNRCARTVGRLLAHQLPIQVLEDGGHYERSPSYHCQVLGDLLDVRTLIGGDATNVVPGITEAVASMRRWLGAMLLPDGDVPLFNDCTLVGVSRVEALGPTLPAQDQAVTVLRSSGYVVMRSGRVHLVADVGPPCPPDLPAHAHADTLSYELAVDGRRLIVDSGTSTYEPGARRRFERSTAAHNTVEVDGGDSTEVWGVFRAARLARARLERVVAEDEKVVVTASHDGYRRLSGRPVHRRTWEVGPDGLDVHDEVTGTGTHRVVLRLYLAPGTTVVPHGDGSLTAGEVRISSPTSLEVGTADVATGFGRLASTAVLAVTKDTTLPASFRMSLTPESPS